MLNLVWEEYYKRAYILNQKKGESFLMVILFDLLDFTPSRRNIVDVYRQAVRTPARISDD